MDNFKYQQQSFSQLSEDFSTWLNEYGYVGLSKEFYENTFERGFSLDQQQDKDIIKSSLFLPMSEDGYINTGTNNIIITKNLQRDARKFIFSESSAYGPFGFYVEIRSKTSNVKNRFVFRHNNNQFVSVDLFGLMNDCDITKKDILKWGEADSVEWLLDDELSSCNKKEDERKANLKIISNTILHDIDCSILDTTKKEIINNEICRFIYYCLECLFEYEDDKDHIGNKIIRQSIFLMNPDKTFIRKKDIMIGFRNSLTSMSHKDYELVSNRNNLDIWCSSRKIILSKENYVDFKVRTLHYSHKKFICPVETTHDIRAGLHVYLSCLSVVAPPPLLEKQKELQTKLLNMLIKDGKRKLFYNGYFLGRVTCKLYELLKISKTINKFVSVYIKKEPVSIRGIYVSDYGGRLMRWAATKEGRLSEGYFVCPNMTVEHETTPENFFLGFAASLIPMIHHNAGARGVFMANMMKQTLEPEGDSCLITKNWNKSDEALIRTLTTEGLRRINIGMNLYVKWATHNGYNIEDGIVMNKKIMSEKYGTLINKFIMKIHKDEHLGLAINNKKFNIDRYDDRGIIKKGQIVTHKDILASKIIFNGDLIKIEHLYAILDNQATVVDIQENKDSLLIFTKYKYKIKVGDKMVSSAAQKGVITKTFTDDKVDIIINPCCIPSRMTMAQIWEGIMTNYIFDNQAAGPSSSPTYAPSSPNYRINERQDDVPAFSLGESAYNDWSEIDHLLQNSTLGTNYRLNKIYAPPFEETTQIFSLMIKEIRNLDYSPKLDDLIPKEDWFCCYNRYFVLGQRVDEKFRVRGEGGVNDKFSFDSQPQKGRKAGGGLRLGVMENDVLCAHNSKNILSYLMSNHSDLIEINFCELCKLYNFDEYCSSCKNVCVAQHVTRSKINLENIMKGIGLEN